MKKRKYIYLSAAVIVIAVGGYFLLFAGGKNDFEYRTEKISRGDILLQVRATGMINPVRTVQVGSQVSGIIERIYVDFNSEVKKGQVLAQIDSTFLYASVKEAEASFERSRAQMNEAERNFSRTTELSKKDLVSQADLDAAKTQYESTVAQQKQAQGALDRAIVNLRYAVITSPIDGVVISRDVDVGQTVASSFQTPKLFSIAMDLHNMQVEASVDEADIGRVKVGQDVTFTVDSYADEQFHGRVSQVRLSPVIVQNVVTYTVIIDVDNPQLKLRPGMTATVSILIDKRENILRVPALATRFQPPQEVLESMKEESDKNSGERKPDGQNIAQAASQQDTSRARFADFQGGRQGQGNPGTDRRQVGGGSMQDPVRMQQAGNRMGSSDQKMNPVKTARIWVLDNGKHLKSINVTVGISDNRYVELIGGELRENDEVIVGTLGNGFASQGTSPFGPQRMRFR